MSKCVEKFLREIGSKSAQPTSRSPLESPWALGEEEFVRRVGRDGLKAFKSAREETVAFTEEISTIEKEIDKRVKTLYGL